MPCDKGLHYLDLKEGRNAKILCTQVVSTVQRNFEGYNRREVEAIKERKLQRMIGGLARADYKGMVCKKLIDDCPIHINDLKSAHNIFGPNLAG